MSDPETEYADALAAFRIARERLAEAKAALPKRLSHEEYWAMQAAKEKAIKEGIWQRYLAGQRDRVALGAEFGVSKYYVAIFIREYIREHRLGPLTLADWEYQEQRKMMAQDFAQERGRRAMQEQLHKMGASVNWQLSGG